VSRRFGYGSRPHRDDRFPRGPVFLLEGLTLTLSPDTWTVHISLRGSRPTGSNDEVLKTVKTSSGRMVKCWIPKIYLTNPNTEPSTSSRPM
jgi:hypothetical protein